jgi:hypothetical protein
MPRPLYPQERNRYLCYRRLVGPLGRFGRVRKISPPPGFDPRNVQPVVSRYTDHGIPAVVYTLCSCQWLRCHLKLEEVSFSDATWCNNPTTAISIAFIWLCPCFSCQWDLFHAMSHLCLLGRMAWGTADRSSEQSCESQIVLIVLMCVIRISTKDQTNTSQFWIYFV